MGKWPLALAIIMVGALALPAMAAECSLAKARYDQKDTTWTLRVVKPKSPDAPNQVADLIVSLGKSDPKLTAAVYMPNGFSQPYGIMNPKCLDGDQADDCKLWEGVVYAAGADGLVVLPELTDPAPQQILLPQFASAIWYSQYAGIGYDSEPSDVFTLASCDP